MSVPRRHGLYKQHSWSVDAQREEAWLRRKNGCKRRSKSVTDEDLDELKACIELGFGFDSPCTDGRLSDTLPALDFYYAVNKQYNESMSKLPTVSEADAFDVGSGSPSTRAIFSPGDSPQLMKTRLKQWAQVVACSAKLSS